MYLYVLAMSFLTFGLTGNPALPNHVIPLYGNASLGYYYANIYVGTPPQQQSVIVDTGSGQLALPCSKCQSCGKSHIHSPFKLSQSNTSKILTCGSKDEACQNSCGSRKASDPCTFSISYAEGSSLSGIVIEDQIQFQGDSWGESIKTSFGCTTKQTNLFFTQAANGIFGLAPRRQSNLFQKLHAKHSPTTGEDLLFTLCLAKNGGQLVIGKPRTQIHQSSKSIKATYSGSHNLYTLEGVGQIRLGDHVLKAKTQSTGTFGTFVDSGSTFTYLPRKNYNSLLVALQNACAFYPDLCLIAKSKSSCFKISPQKKSTVQQTIIKIFPPFEVQIGQQIVLWSPADYFILRSLNSKQVCLGIQSLDRFLLGGNWMVNKDIVFNLKQSTMEIFSNSRCQIGSQSKFSFFQQLTQPQVPQKIIQLQKLKQKSKQTTEDQMPVYTGESNQQLSYINAIFRQDNTTFQTILIMACIVGLILGAFVALGKYSGGKKRQIELKQEEGQTVTITQNAEEIKPENSINNNLQKKNSNDEIRLNKISEQKQSLH